MTMAKKKFCTHICKLLYFYITLLITYIRLFKRHAFSANSTLKPCIKSTWINISRNQSKSHNLPDMQETVKFTRMHFSRLDVLANIAENGCTRKKTWYTVLLMTFYTISTCITHDISFSYFFVYFLYFCV